MWWPDRRHRSHCGINVNYIDFIKVVTDRAAARAASVEPPASKFASAVFERVHEVSEDVTIALNQLTFMTRVPQKPLTPSSSTSWPLTETKTRCRKSW